MKEREPSITVNILDDLAPSQECDFQDIFNLIGHEQGLNLLAGVVHDTEVAIAAARACDEDASDLLHRAIGTAAAVGLLQLSECLRDAEKTVRANGDVSTILSLLQDEYKNARNEVFKAEYRTSYSGRNQ